MCTLHTGHPGVFEPECPRVVHAPTIQQLRLRAGEREQQHERQGGERTRTCPHLSDRDQAIQVTSNTRLETLILEA